MGKSLKSADFEEGMRVFFSPNPVPIVGHTIWYGDFMGLCKHDVPCPVCWNESALMRADVTPGRARSQMGPCEACYAKGWEMVRLPVWLRWLLTPVLGERL